MNNHTIQLRTLVRKPNLYSGMTLIQAHEAVFHSRTLQYRERMGEHGESQWIWSEWQDIPEEVEE